jgi:hypothetical protein
MFGMNTYKNNELRNLRAIRNLEHVRDNILEEIDYIQIHDVKSEEIKKKIAKKKLELENNNKLLNRIRSVSIFKNIPQYDPLRELIRIRLMYNLNNKTDIVKAVIDLKTLIECGKTMQSDWGLNWPEKYNKYQKEIELYNKEMVKLERHKQKISAKTPIINTNHNTYGLRHRSIKN